jgi:hypothetical protein
MPNPSDELVITSGLLRAWPLPDPQGDKQVALCFLTVLEVQMRPWQVSRPG